MIKEIEIRKILPDEEQPRKYFDAIKMKSLKASIAKHGIMRPLDVEDMGNDKYLLEDGERRFRVATELKMKTVPCNVGKLLTAPERLIRQFNIQEQQEAWTPLEKAMSLLNLSKALGLDLKKTCEMLDIPSRDASRYIAFAELADKQNFVKNEIPLTFAPQIRVFKGIVKRLSRDILKAEFIRSDEKTLEHQVTKGIVRGTINSKSDLTRIGDAFKKNPKLIDKFMSNDKVTPDGLFLEAKAEGAHALRNATNSARQVTYHARAFLRERDVEISQEQIDIFKSARNALKDIIGLVE